MSKIITLSGWGMAHDALASVTPEGTKHIDYSNFTNAKKFIESLKAEEPDVVVGWSLGGQLALRAVSEGIIKPKALILLSTPYQFVENKDIRCAMHQDDFNLFYSNFKNHPEKTLKRFITLVSLNDSNMHELLAKLRQTACASNNYMKWLYWLEELEKFSCHGLDFSKMPEIFAVHGRDDTVVDVMQTSLFTGLSSNYKLEVFGACGHAPHLHNENRVREIIQSAL